MASPSADKKQANRVVRQLRKNYEHAACALNFETPLQLLIATILSAQCTDERVNLVTEKLFKKYPTNRDLADAPIRSLEKLIQSTGFFRHKAKNIKACCQRLVDEYGGEVPPELESLVTLAGVGRKTANVVLGAAFDTPGMVVDTHVARISQRLGLTRNKDAVKIEFDLMKIVPKKAWNDFSLQLIFFGRETCSARKPICYSCPMTKLCPYPDKTAGP